MKDVLITILVKVIKLIEKYKRGKSNGKQR